MKAQELTDLDGNLDVDDQASNSVVLYILWGMEENGGHPLCPSHLKLDCAHGGDAI